MFDYRALVRSVAKGALAGAFVPIIILVTADVEMVLDSGASLLNPPLLFITLFVPFAIIATLGFLASLLFLPSLTQMLERRDLERPGVYSAVGCVVGGLIATALTWGIGGEATLEELGWIFVSIGMLTGCVTGWTWGAERKRLRL